MEKINQIRSLVSNSRLEEALSKLISINQEYITLQQTYNSAKRENMMGLLTHDEWFRKRNQVSYNILESLKLIEEKESMKIYIINLSTKPKDFAEWVDSLNFDQLQVQMKEQFKNDPELLEKLFDVTEPITSKMNRGKALEVGDIKTAKDSLVYIFTTYQKVKIAAKVKQQKSDLNTINSILQAELSEDLLKDAWELLELFLVSNTNFGGLLELCERREKLLYGRSDEVLRKHNRLEERLKEEKAWIIMVNNNIILHLEK